MNSPIVTLVALALLGAGPAFAGDDPVIGEVLEILRDRGDIDEAKYTELMAKNQSYQTQQSGLLGRIEFSGDLRGRLENFWFDEDANNFEQQNRTRGRYRLRLQGKAKVNDHVTAVFRLASGENDIRSTNQSAGKENDFGPDSIFIDRAYIELKPSLEKDLKVVVGKQGNPFRWKKGKDYMLWDSDINPEGAAVRWKGDVADGISAFANVGYMVLDENGTRKDPHFIGIQGGLSAAVTENVEVGGRVSWYSFGSVDPAFLGRGGSNVELTDPNVPAGTPDGFDVIELAGYVSCDCIEDWPALFYFHWAKNSGAEDFVQDSDQDTGWGVGFEIGDKKKLAKIGLGYYRLEADYFPSQFIDSDLTDGRTNRKGWTVYGSKSIWKNTDLNLTLFVSDDIESNSLFSGSTSNADRVRLQTDIVVKF